MPFHSVDCSGVSTRILIFWNFGWWIPLEWYWNPQEWPESGRNQWGIDKSSLNGCPAEVIWLFTNHSWCWMSAYHIGLTGEVAQWAVQKQKGNHCSVLRTVMMNLDTVLIWFLLLWQEKVDSLIQYCTILFNLSVMHHAPPKKKKNGAIMWLI